MTKYSSVPRRQAPKRDQPHPIWRGIGCLTMIIVPLISYAVAKISIDYGLEHGWPIPYQLLGSPRLPDLVYDVPVLFQIFGRLTSWTHMYAYLAATLLLTILLGGILSFGYAVVYAIIGPSRWGPLDIPPPKGIKSRAYKR